MAQTQSNAVLDWLSINCIKPLHPIMMNNVKMTSKTLPYSTKHFALVEEWFQGDDLVFTSSSKPTSPVIPQNTFQIKFNNKFLYQNNLYNILTDLINDNNLTFKSMSRIDVAIDFNLFYRNLKPTSFIKSVFTKRYLKKQRSLFQTISNTSIKGLPTYARFGRNTSDYCSYLYNKTFEMDSVKNKPWIRDNWKLHDMPTNMDIWRLEFSIKNARINLTDTDSGEFTNVNQMSILSPQNINILFWTFYINTFEFVINNGLSRIDRMPKLKLLTPDITNLKTIRFTEFHDSGRADKIYINKLNNHYNELRTAKSENTDSALRTLRNYIETRQMQSYCIKKGIAI